MGGKPRRKANKVTNHFRGKGHGGNFALCMPGGGTNHILWDRWDKVDCPKCIKLMPQRIHHGVEDARGNIRSTSCGIKRSAADSIKKGPLAASSTWSWVGPDRVTRWVNCKKCESSVPHHIFESRIEPDGSVTWLTGCGLIEGKQGEPRGTHVITEHMWAAVTCDECLKRKPEGDVRIVHKLGGDNLTLCGKTKKLRVNGIRIEDSWKFVDCEECLALKPAEICVAHMPEDTAEHLRFGGSFDCDPGPDRWEGDTFCGQKSEPGDVTWFDGRPTCLECMAHDPHPRHMYRKGSRSSLLCGATKRTSMIPSRRPENVTCLDCVRRLRAEHVPELLEEAAPTLATNALIAARNQDRKIARGDCGCTAGSMLAFGSAARCVTCSVLEFRSAADTDKDAEDAVAALLAVPREWVIDMNRGWDGDAVTDVTYDSAYKIGRKLWRKHGDH